MGQYLTILGIPKLVFWIIDNICKTIYIVRILYAVHALFLVTRLYVGVCVWVRDANNKFLSRLLASNR